MTTIEDLYFLLEIINHSDVVEGRKRFQKTICVLRYRDHIPISFDFVPYYYGPYSETLAGTIQSLVGAGYVREDHMEVDAGIFQYEYSLTEQGQRAIQQIQLAGNINGIPIDDLQNKIDEINKMELNDLVRLSKTLI